MAIIKPNNNTLSAITALPAAISTGSLVKLATQTLSGDSSVSFDGYFSSTYKDYIVKFQNFKPATNNSNFYFRVRQSNADVTSNSYGSANLRVYRDDDYGDGSSAGGHNNTYADLLYNIGVNNGSEGGISGDLILHNPLETSDYKYITVNYIFTQGDDTSKTISGHSLVRFTANTNALSGFTLYFSSGNISSGTIQLYGVES